MRKKWIHTLVGVAILSNAIPMTAHADQGVFLSPYKIKNEEGVVVHSFDKGDRIRINENNVQSYSTEINYRDYQIEKEVLLRTHNEEELSLTVKGEEAVIRSSPSIFGESIQIVKEKDSLKRVKESKKEGDWIQVETSEGLVGWIHEQYVESVFKTSASNESKTLYAKDSVNKDGVSLQYADSVSISDYRNGQYKAVQKGKTAWISERLLSFTKPSPKPIQETEKATSSNGLLSKAYQHIGTPYVFGANGNGAFDCSSFTQTVFRQSGISIPRTTIGQSQIGTTVSKSNLQPGDLVFFETYRSGVSHVGIYTGNGKMVHAGTSRGVEVTSINSSYWSQRYLFSKRI